MKSKTTKNKYLIAIFTLLLAGSFVFATAFTEFESIEYDSIQGYADFAYLTMFGNATSHVNITSDGIILSGNARVKDNIQFYPYNTGGITGTYNGVTNGGSGLASINGIYLNSFDDGIGSGTAEAVNIAILLPENYVDGTDLTLQINWLTGATTGVTRWQAGLTNIADGGTYNPSTYTWATPIDATVQGTAWGKSTQSFTLNGTGLARNDNVPIIIFRDADNGADTSSGDSYISQIIVKYTINGIGEAS